MVGGGALCLGLGDHGTNGTDGTDAADAAGGSNPGKPGGGKNSGWRFIQEAQQNQTEVK